MNKKLAVEYISTETIKPYANNPKCHSNKQVKQIVASITEFNFTNPILIDEDNITIAGHGRLLAAKKLGMAKVPVIKLLHLSDAQKKAYRISKSSCISKGNTSSVGGIHSPFSNFDFGCGMLIFTEFI